MGGKFYVVYFTGGGIHNVVMLGGVGIVQKHVAARAQGTQKAIFREKVEDVKNRCARDTGKVGIDFAEDFFGGKMTVCAEYMLGNL